MRKLVILGLLAALLSSCSYVQVHKMEVEQGNIISANRVKQLHIGMSREEVLALMGKPQLANVYGGHTMTYIYTYQLGSAKPTQERVILTLDKRDRVISIEHAGI